MRTIQLGVACVAVLVATAGQVQAGVITGFDIPQSATDYTSIAPIIGGSPDVTASPLFRTNNLSGSAFGNHFYFYNWDSFVNLSKFYSTTLTVDLGKVLSLGDLTYSVEDTGHPTPGAFSTFHVRSSLDSFSSDIDSFSLANNSGLVVNRTTDLSSLGNITGSIEFRFYATTETTSVTMGFANHLPGGAGGGSSDAGQNIRFNGDVADVSPVPEPSSLALFGIGACVAGTVAARRRRPEKQQQAMA